MKIILVTELEMKLWPYCIVVQAGYCLSFLEFCKSWINGLTGYIFNNCVVGETPAGLYCCTGWFDSDRCSLYMPFDVFYIGWNVMTTFALVIEQVVITSSACNDCSWSRSHCCSCDLPPGALYNWMMIIVLIHSSNSANLIRLHSCAGWSQSHWCWWPVPSDVWCIFLEPFGWRLFWRKS